MYTIQVAVGVHSRRLPSRRVYNIEGKNEEARNPRRHYKTESPTPAPAKQARLK
jgi:hypothetical protein